MLAVIEQNYSTFQIGLYRELFSRYRLRCQGDHRRSSIIFIWAMTLIIGCEAPGQPSDPLKLVNTIPLDHVEGRIDHFGLDAGGQRLFMAALGNNTIEVIDLAAGKVVRHIKGLSTPQGV